MEGVLLGPPRDIPAVVISPLQIIAEKARCLMSAKMIPKCGGWLIGQRKRGPWESLMVDL